ncbi:MAG: enoyl-CoA hydratase-related protein, partial [Pseudomonadota bacterium]
MLDITHSGDIAILKITNPPVNALSHAVRLALFEAFDTLSHEKKAKAVVLTGAGRFFVAGADITEFGKPPKAPILPDLIALIEESPLPAVAAIHGAALGGGLELALACSHRIAVERTKFALPETQLGLIPGAGGTQRVPRLCGIENAIKMVTSTTPLSAKEALDIGLIDECVDEDRLIERATEIANSLIGEPRRRVGQLPKPAVDQEAIDRYRKTFKAERPGQFALSQAVESVIASTELDLDEGAKRERARFMTCMEGPERAGLIHAFFADRRAAKVPELKVGEARDVSAAGVIGGGTMGAGIAASMLLSGLSVTMIERDEEAA